MNVRYQERYTGEIVERAGLLGRSVVVFDGDGHRSLVPLDAFERAYEAIDLVAKPGDECHELWLGDSFKGELRRTSGGYALRIAGERFENPCRHLWDVVDDLGLAPGTRVWGL